MGRTLDIVNSMLQTIGTAALVSEDSSHPDYIDAKVTLDRVLAEMSANEYWFNTVYRTLTPATDGSIIVPSNALSCAAVDTRKNYFIKGTKLFDPDNYTFNIGVPTEVRMVLEFSIEDMPPVALSALKAQARFEFFFDQDGSAKKAEALARAAQKAELQLDAVNMRQANTNYFDGVRLRDHRNPF